MSDKRHTHTDTCRWLSTEAAAEHASVSVWQIKQWHNRRHLNRFPSRKIGYHTVRIRACELDQWLINLDEQISRDQLVS